MPPVGSWALKRSQKARGRQEGVSKQPRWEEVFPPASVLDSQAACCNSAQTSEPCTAMSLVVRPPVRNLTWVGVLSGHPAGEHGPAQHQLGGHLPTALNESGLYLPKHLALYLCCWLSCPVSARARAWVVHEVWVEAEASDAEASDIRMRAPNPCVALYYR